MEPTPNDQLQTNHSADIDWTSAAGFTSWRKRWLINASAENASGKYAACNLVTSWLGENALDNSSASSFLGSMKKLVTTVIALMAIGSQAAYPPLPPSFVTTKGQTIQSGVALDITAKGVKIMHGSGLNWISPAELPPDVQSLLGLTVAAMPSVTLPHPFKAGSQSYDHATVLGIDPDGIRIRHDNGTAKVRYEALPNELQSKLGGFTAEKAIAFRAAEQQNQSTAQRQIAATAAAVAQMNNTNAGPAPTDVELDKLRTDPNYITPAAQVKVGGRSQGGKSRYEPWKTDYGSYQRTDTSSRQYMCSVTSTSRYAQRVRVQCFVLTRSLTDRGMDINPVQNILVDLPANGVKTVSASSVVANTDDNYAALGIRERSGDKYLGWTWRVIDGNNRVVGVVSSTPGYDHYALEQPVEASR